LTTLHHRNSLTHVAYRLTPQGHNNQFDSHEDSEWRHVDTNAVNSLHGADLHAPTETPDQSHPGEDGTPFVEQYPSGLAGAPISNAGQSMPGFPQNGLSADNIWSPFQTQRDWDFAQWAKNRGLSSTAVTELLAMEGVCRNGIKLN
jgi:hypothetical protein